MLKYGIIHVKKLKMCQISHPLDAWHGHFNHCPYPHETFRICMDSTGAVGQGYMGPDPPRYPLAQHRRRIASHWSDNVLFTAAQWGCKRSCVTGEFRIFLLFHRSYTQTTFRPAAPAAYNHQTDSRFFSLLVMVNGDILRCGEPLNNRHSSS